MCDILASKLTLKIIELVLNTFYNEMLQIMKELHGKFEGKKWWPRIKSSLGESTMIDRNRIQCRIKVTCWLKCTLIISKSTNHDKSFPEQHKCSINKFGCIHVGNDTGCLPSTVSIVVNICQLILRETTPNATFRTWQHMFPFVNAKNIRIAMSLTILTNIYQA